MARYITLGLLAGLFAAVLAFVVATLTGEPSIEAAIALEEQASTNHHLDMATSVGQNTDISRAAQKSSGLFIGLALFGAALGGLFSIVFAVAQGRLTVQSPRQTIAVLGSLGFVSVALLPMLKYPGNPPAIGNPETIGARTALYFIFMLFSIGSITGAIAMVRGAKTTRAKWLRGGVLYALLMALAFVLAPSTGDMSSGFPSTVLWTFRASNLAVHATLWAAISLCFAWLIERTMPDHQHR
ncbi:CbtA family protein [Nitratireductor aquibiodomus]|uniref:CbtA family protein n=1 Tax=Nitratireductor aquibiodomus TaxID=204799 RepID=UPI00046801FF|nr:CbtA family protein [Nitratireductor aquibiodomus]